MLKGITPVIAVILLLLITISIVGIAFTFFQRTTEAATTAGTSQLETQTQQLGTQFAIENVAPGKVYIRNRGTTTIDSSSLGVYVNNKRFNYTLAAGVGPDGVGELAIIAGSCKDLAGDSVIRITAGTSSDTVSEKFNDGVYKIKPGLQAVDVYCDQTTDGGGWTLAAVCAAPYPYVNEPGPASGCWTAGPVGIATDPNSATSAKLSDDAIRFILANGEKTTRAWWRQHSRHNQNPGGEFNPVTAAVFNRFTDPGAWSSSPCGSAGKEFFSKQASADNFNADITPLSSRAYAAAWGPSITSLAGGCSCPVNGWSNTLQEACGFATWFAVCENAPSMSHNCAGNAGTAGDLAEQANIILWIR